MKSPRALVMILVSVVIGLGAVVLASRWMVNQVSISTSPIVVAATDIDLGTPLTPQMLTVANWPRSSLPPGTISDVKQLESRVVRTSIQRGEPILESKLAPVGTKGGLSAVISEGKRAMTVRVNDVIGVAGFALPGNYVDIMVNTENDASKASGKDKMISKIVLEHVLVLAVAQEASRDETKPKVVNAVTLEVTPEQAEKLDLARSVGSLTLVLRNQMDKSAVNTTGADKDEMLRREGEPLAAPAPVVVPPQPVVAKRASPKRVKKTRQARVGTQQPTGGSVMVIKGIQQTDQRY